MSNIDISKLLQESRTPLETMNAYSRGLAPKWEKTGLLEGLKENEKGAMAVLLENQARELLKEASSTNVGGTVAAGEQWSGVALPLVRKVFGEVAAKEFVSVQPMNLPSGLIFYLDFEYGTGVGPFTAGKSVYGDTTSSAAPDGGLYGAGRFSYTIPAVTASGLTQLYSAIAVATSASVNFDDALIPYLAAATGSATTPWLAQITVALSSLTGADPASVRSWVPSGSGFTTYYPELTKLNATRDSVVFTVASTVTTGSTANLGIGKITYSKQPTDSTRGDFEDKVGQSFASVPSSINAGADLNIPEINIELRSEPVVAKTRKLKAVWTPELAQDLNAYHSVDAEAELTAILSEHIALEIDLEILDMLFAYAQTTKFWSAQVGMKWNGSVSSPAFSLDPGLSGQAWTSMTWYQTLGNKLQAVSNEIHRLTLRGGANWAVVSPEIATILETIPGFTAKTDGNQASFAMGVTAVGSFQNRFTIYKNPYILNNVILMGFRGSNFLETGAVYAPYIPLIMTPLVYDPNNFTPRRGVMTRYAKKMVRPEFFGKIVIANLDNAI